MSKLREIVLDTETTGLDIDSGHRIIEIGCVELVNKVRSGVVFHEYINPCRDVPYHSTKIHGITDEMLKDKPVFEEIAQKFIDFTSDSALVIHNAGFDVKFINMELGRLNHGSISSSRVIDTLSMARRKFMGSPASLDALCKRFNISLESREVHGALVDAELLAKVYVEMTGGLQISFFHNAKQSRDQTAEGNDCSMSKKYYKPRDFPLSQEEINAHIELLKSIKNPIWMKFV
ncbi:DNA polymerase III subunit epsilon [Candidatus Mesenet endosymbiont of Agriotes lineatus]|uniref:DNA polymerase III subunit epsilon n=1 Tax=Candidatus Mesenet endosymbiont of Agriotes lineatus TaxID=3077948 RepID=UPI0030D4E869